MAVPVTMSRLHYRLDLGRIVAGSAFKQVAAVARIPNHAIIAGLAEDLVTSSAASQHIVAAAD